MQLCVRRVAWWWWEHTTTTAEKREKKSSQRMGCEWVKRSKPVANTAQTHSTSLSRNKMKWKKMWRGERAKRMRYPTSRKRRYIVMLCVIWASKKERSEPEKLITSFHVAAACSLKLRRQLKSTQNRALASTSTSGIGDRVAIWGGTNTGSSDYWLQRAIEGDSTIEAKKPSRREEKWRNSKSRAREGILARLEVKVGAVCDSLTHSKGRQRVELSLKILSNAQQQHEKTLHKKYI